MLRQRALAAWAIVMALASGTVQAISIGTNDTFVSGTTEGWFAGGIGGQFPPVPPQVIASGGPAGAGDPFLQITAQGGAGPGSRLVAMNATQWAGNYLAAGVGSIEMDLINLGQTDLAIRLLFEDPIAGPPQNIAVSTLGFLLPAGGGWVHASFDLGDLTALIGDVASALSNTTLLRIIHASAASGATPIAGVLGIDNILAVAAPVAVDEPSSALLTAGALIALVLLRLQIRSAGWLPRRR